MPACWSGCRRWWRRARTPRWRVLSSAQARPRPAAPRRLCSGVPGPLTDARAPWPHSSAAPVAWRMPRRRRHMPRYPSACQSVCAHLAYMECRHMPRASATRPGTVPHVRRDRAPPSTTHSCFCGCSGGLALPGQLLNPAAPPVQRRRRGRRPRERGAAPRAGCKRCKHEGGRANAVPHHGPRNPCAACAAAGGAAGDGGRCVPRPGAACGCAFHARAGERAVARVRRPYPIYTLSPCR